MNIPITKPTIDDEEVRAVGEVVKSGFLVQGKKTQEVEAYIAQKVGRKYAIMVTNGTSALTTALSSLELKKGDEVITPAFTFFASASCIVYAGATPVFVDINPDTFNISPADVEKKITKKTKAIIAVSLFGQPFKYDEVRNIAKKYRLLLIEDAAQSIGSLYGEKASGSLGDISTFSFYGSKVVTCGEGGMILTDNEKLKTKMLLFKNHGIDPEQAYNHVALGYNYRITDMQSALLLEQVKKLEKFIALRNLAADYYTKKIKDTGGIVVPSTRAGNKHGFSVYTLRIQPKFGKRDEVLQKLNQAGVGARVYYPSILPLQPVWKKIGYSYSSKDYPNALKAAQEVLSLPLFPGITRSEQNYVIKTLLNSRS